MYIHAPLRTRYTSSCTAGTAPNPKPQTPKPNSGRDRRRPFFLCTACVQRFSTDVRHLLPRALHPALFASHLTWGAGSFAHWSEWLICSCSAAVARRRFFLSLSRFLLSPLSYLYPPGLPQLVDTRAQAPGCVYVGHVSGVGLATDGLFPRCCGGMVTGHGILLVVAQSKHAVNAGGASTSTCVT